MAVSDQWLEDSEQWATAEYLQPDSIKFLQARLKRLVREYRALRNQHVANLAAQLEQVSSGPPIPYDPDTDAQQIQENNA